MSPVVDSLPDTWDVLVWYNGPEPRMVYYDVNGDIDEIEAVDCAVFGRYVAASHAKSDLVYVQDDDCVVSNPQALVDAWWEWHERYAADLDVPPSLGHVVCNMPQKFRHDFYRDHALVGFGAVFHRHALQALGQGIAIRYPHPTRIRPDWPEFFHRTCDIFFTVLNPRVLVDLPYTDREFASDEDRMWRQPGHVGERKEALELALGALTAEGGVG